MTIRIRQWQSFLAAIVLAGALASPALADLNFMFDITDPGLVSTLDVSHVGTPVHTYQVKGLAPGDTENGAGYDPSTNTLYWVNNHSDGTASLMSLQFNGQGAVVSQSVIGLLPSLYVTESNGADFYAGRIWINNNDTNKVYGFDPGNLSASPIVLTLPPPASHPSTHFNLGDLTFDAAAKTMFIAGNISGGNPTFIYKYDVSNTASPTLIASRDYTASSSDPFFNGIIYNQSTGTLFGYAQTTGHLYTIDTTSLTVASDVGSNPALLEFGDLAGFSPTGLPAVPEPSGMVIVTSIVGLVMCGSRKVRNAALMQFRRSR